MFKVNYAHVKYLQISSFRSSLRQPFLSLTDVWLSWLFFCRWLNAFVFHFALRMCAFVLFFRCLQFIIHSIDFHGWHLIFWQSETTNSTDFFFIVFDGETHDVCNRFESDFFRLHLNQYRNNCRYVVTFGATTPGDVTHGNSDIEKKAENHFMTSDQFSFVHLWLSAVSPIHCFHLLKKNHFLKIKENAQRATNTRSNQNSFVIFFTVFCFGRELILSAFCQLNFIGFIISLRNAVATVLRRLGSSSTSVLWNDYILFTWKFIASFVIAFKIQWTQKSVLRVAVFFFLHNRVNIVVIAEDAEHKSLDFITFRPYHFQCNSKWRTRQNDNRRRMWWLSMNFSINNRTREKLCWIDWNLWSIDVLIEKCNKKFTRKKNKIA